MDCHCIQGKFQTPNHDLWGVTPSRPCPPLQILFVPGSPSLTRLPRWLLSLPPMLCPSSEAFASQLLSVHQVSTEMPLLLWGLLLTLMYRLSLYLHDSCFQNSLCSSSVITCILLIAGPSVSLRALYTRGANVGTPAIGLQSIFMCIILWGAL